MNHPTDRTSGEIPVSTIDPARAETDAWDAVVIGAGLAGSITARARVPHVCCFIPTFEHWVKLRSRLQELHE